MSEDNKDDLEKAHIIFQESKAKLLSAKTNCEQLANTVFRLTSICIGSIVGLTAILSFVKNIIYLKAAILILIVGFVHSLFKVIQSLKTNLFASDGLKASTIFKDEECMRDNASVLFNRLSLTYEEKADHNNKISAQIAGRFDNTLKILKRYFLCSLIMIILGFLTTEIFSHPLSKEMVLNYLATLV